MDKKIIGSIFFLIGIFLAVVSIQSFFDHTSNPYLLLPNISGSSSEGPSVWEPIRFRDNQSVEQPVTQQQPNIHSEKSSTEDNDLPVSLLDTICALINLISAIVSAYVAHVGYKMYSEESQKNVSHKNLSSDNENQGDRLMLTEN